MTPSGSSDSARALAERIKANADVLADLAVNNIDSFVELQPQGAVRVEATFLSSREPPWEATLTTHRDSDSEPTGTGRASGRTLREAVSMAVGGFTPGWRS